MIMYSSSVIYVFVQSSQRERAFEHFVIREFQTKRSTSDFEVRVYKCTYISKRVHHLSPTSQRARTFKYCFSKREFDARIRACTFRINLYIYIYQKHTHVVHSSQRARTFGICGCSASLKRTYEPALCKIFISIDQSTYICSIIAHNACVPFDYFCEARIWRIHTSVHFGNTFICIDQSAYRFLVLAHNSHVRHNIVCEAPCWRIRTSLNFRK